MCSCKVTGPLGRLGILGNLGKVATDRLGHVGHLGPSPWPKNDNREVDPGGRARAGRTRYVRVLGRREGRFEGSGARSPQCRA